MRLHPGEPEAGHRQVTALSTVVARLRAAAPEVTGRPLTVAVDGRGGAGKSVLAQRLQAAVPSSAVVHTDDIAWHQAYFDWADLMADHVLRPLHRGQAVEFRPPAWVAHGRDGTVHVPAGLEVVWVEGTGVLRDALLPWIDASIWVQGDLDEQERRLVDRDGDSADQRAHVAAWLAEELPHLLREQPWHKATVVVDGTSALPRDPGTEVVVATFTV
ncbi:uridine kinase [Lentzea sp. NPDC060358]|uniref:uridine kinase family protein n=1 Tax=Lentzea sp. NPDC060358 TaxID=3347103 RepID=UPI00364BAA8E